jgi:hypothetical protein
MNILLFSNCVPPLIPEESPGPKKIKQGKNLKAGFFSTLIRFHHQ